MTKEGRPRSPPTDRAKELRTRQLADLKFRHQHLIGPYLVVFYCVVSRVAGRLPADCGDRWGLTRAS